jgi:hypothetical protein
MDNYLGYLDERHFLFWTSRFKGRGALPTRLPTLVLSRTFRSWSGVFTPA